jgi:hypothetical protein
VDQHSNYQLQPLSRQQTPLVNIKKIVIQSSNSFGGTRKTSEQQPLNKAAEPSLKNQYEELTKSYTQIKQLENQEEVFKRQGQQSFGKPTSSSVWTSKDMYVMQFSPLKK